MFISPIINIENKQQLRDFVNRTAYQLSNVTGDVTLNGTNTTIKNPKIYNETTIMMVPRNTIAMTTKYYINEINTGEFTIVHDNVTNAKFDYILFGVK
ncbi:hypothetical protein A6U96_14005 [Agrobacterium tumefaciens]|nr:hypothetical protein A6U96_14005 [Agrobacterium tumefaciens]